ncbi:DNA repair protein RadC [Vibrio sp. 1F292]|uniref:RadC family protein n=2 Tax=unclassified Vibrio TaxID=2614977 RepID=UPI00352BD27A
MSVLANYSNHSLFSVEEKDILHHAASILKSKLFVSEQTPLNSPELVKSFCQASLASNESEVFGVIFLDSQHRVLRTKEMFNGTIDTASVYPREVVKESLATNAIAVIFYHNHPSGDATPSQADRRITRRLTDALALVDIRVLDHFVVSFEDVVSFVERGWI